jgi:hypothetical protein
MIFILVHIILSKEPVLLILSYAKTLFCQMQKVETYATKKTYDFPR